MEFKTLVDTLASVASIIAIITAMISWYRSAKRPLSITRVVVHKSAEGTKFIVFVKNVKDYPVTINSIECYRKKKYEVQKRQGGKPEYSELFLGTEMVFPNKGTFEIPANGHANIQISISSVVDVPRKLLFLTRTSHGFHELWCKEVIVVEVGQPDVYSLEYKHEYESKWIAKTKYYVALIRELTIRCSRRLSCG